MRDRLIELIKETRCEKDCDGFQNIETCKACTAYEKHAKSADHLLANGVIVLPCKVGDKVYIKNREITIDEVFLGEELLFSTYFDCDWVMENIGCEDCPFADWEQSYEGEWDCRTRGWFSFAEKDIGKTVFLTREEAERALKGGNDDSCGKEIKKCTGKRCPMQVGYDVRSCKDKECIYRTEGGVE